LSETSLAKPSPSEALGREPTGRTSHVFKRGNISLAKAGTERKSGGDRCHQTRKKFHPPDSATRFAPAADPSL